MEANMSFPESNFSEPNSHFDSQNLSEKLKKPSEKKEETTPIPKRMEKNPGNSQEKPKLQADDDLAANEKKTPGKIYLNKAKKASKLVRGLTLKQQAELALESFDQKKELVEQKVKTDAIKHQQQMQQIQSAGLQAEKSATLEIKQKEAKKDPDLFDQVRSQEDSYPV